MSNRDIRRIGERALPPDVRRVMDGPSVIKAEAPAIRVHGAGLSGPPARELTLGQPLTNGVKRFGGSAPFTVRIKRPNRCLAEATAAAFALRTVLNREWMERAYREDSPRVYFDMIKEQVVRLERKLLALEGAGQGAEAKGLREGLVQYAIEQGMFVAGSIMGIVSLPGLISGISYGEAFKRKVLRFLREVNLFKDGIYRTYTGLAGAEANGETGKIGPLPAVKGPYLKGPKRIPKQGEWAHYIKFRKGDEPGAELSLKQTEMFLKMMARGMMPTLRRAESTENTERTDKGPKGRFYIPIKPEVYVKKAAEVARLFIEKAGELEGRFEFKVITDRKEAARLDHIVVYFAAADAAAVLGAVKDVVRGIGRKNMRPKGPHFTLKVDSGIFFGQEPYMDESFGGLVARKAFKTGRRLVRLYEDIYEGGLDRDTMLKVFAYAFDLMGVDTEDPAFVKGGQKDFPAIANINPRSE